MPAVGGIIEGAVMERFCRSFAMILHAGVPLIQGIGIVANSVGNEYIGSKLQQMRIGIEKGDSISRMAKSIGLVSSPGDTNDYRWRGIRKYCRNATGSSGIL